MASRAILRRRSNFIHQYSNASGASISSFHSPLRSFTTKPNTPQSNGTNEISRYKEELFNFSPVLGQFVRGFASAGFRGDFTRLRLNESLGVRWLSQSSAAAAKKDEAVSDDVVGKKRKEASPEECDQAVEGLTTAKAKAAMAKRSQESQKVVQSVLQRVRAVFLGIGPALRAVASMSRLVTSFS